MTPAARHGPRLPVTTLETSTAPNSCQTSDPPSPTSPTLQRLVWVCLEEAGVSAGPLAVLRVRTMAAGAAPSANCV